MNQISNEMTKIAYAALEEKLAEDISIIDISEVSSLADYFLIATGKNINQVQAIVDNVQEKLYKAGYKEVSVEGFRSGSWVLLDYKDIVVHVFSAENRRFYDLERVWRDGKNITIEEL